MTDLTWNSRHQIPDDWHNRVAQCGGGPFHVLESLPAGIKRGIPVFWTLNDRRGATEGVALSFSTQCRISRAPRHVLFHSLPAVTSRINPDTAVDRLARAVARSGAAEAEMFSFDSKHTPKAGNHRRIEYVIPLRPEEEMFRKLGLTQRRQVRKCDSLGWTVRFLTGDIARDAIATAQQATAERAASLARGFRLGPPNTHRDVLVSTVPLPDTGLAVLAAFAGDELLAAILTGWAAGRSYYHQGGSTSAGFRVGAAAWLHWRVMRLMAESGLTVYNAGGTPIHAPDANSPANGLYRFKMGLGAVPMERSGLAWTFSHWHALLHRLGGRLKGSSM